MSRIIGESSGKVWQFLHSNGAASLKKIVDNTGLDKDLANRAIGWLAREGKVKIEGEGKKETFSLLS